MSMRFWPCNYIWSISIMPGFRVHDYTHLLKCSCKVTVTLIHRHAQSSKQLELPSTHVCA